MYLQHTVKCTSIQSDDLLISLQIKNTKTKWPHTKSYKIMSYNIIEYYYVFHIYLVKHSF